MNPSTSESAFSFWIASNNSSSLTVSSNAIFVDLKPTCSHERTLFFTYVSLPPSWPTMITAKCGIFPPLALISATSAAISSFTCCEMAFPSISCILLFFCGACWAHIIFFMDVSDETVLSHIRHTQFTFVFGNHTHHFSSFVKLLKQSVYFL